MNTQDAIKKVNSAYNAAKKAKEKINFKDVVGKITTVGSDLYYSVLKHFSDTAAAKKKAKKEANVEVSNLTDARIVKIAKATAKQCLPRYREDKKGKRTYTTVEGHDMDGNTEFTQQMKLLHLGSQDVIWFINKKKALAVLVSKVAYMYPVIREQITGAKTERQGKHYVLYTFEVK